MTMIEVARGQAEVDGPDEQRAVDGTPTAARALPTVAVAIATFLGGRDASPKTRATYAVALDRFSDFLAESAALDVTVATTGELTSEMLANFFSWLATHAYQPLTYRTYLAGTRAFLLELLLTDQGPGINPEKMRQLLKRRLPRSDYPHVDPSARIPAVVAYYDTLPLPPPARPQARLTLLRNRALLHTLYSTCLRVGEATRVRRGQVQDSALGAIREGFVVVGKGQRRREVFLTPAACTALAAYLRERADGDPYLFVSHGRGPAARATSDGPTTAAGPPAPAARGRQKKSSAHGRPLTTVSLWRIVQRAAAAAGAPEVHPHLFRHYRASHWLSVDGLPLDQVQALLGHSDISLTRKVYAMHLGGLVREAFFGAPPPPADPRLLAHNGEDPL